MLAIFSGYILLLISNADTCKMTLYNKVLEDSSFERSFFIKVQVELPNKTKEEIVTTNYFLYNYLKGKLSIDYAAYKNFFLNKVSNNLSINIDGPNAFFYSVVDSNKSQTKKIVKKGKNHFLRNYVAKDNTIHLKKLNGLNEFEAYAILWDLNIGVRWGADEAIPYINFICE